MGLFWTIKHKTHVQQGFSKYRLPDTMMEGSWNKKSTTLA
jgi:hypothetical protein